MTETSNQGTPSNNEIWTFFDDLWKTWRWIGLSTAGFFAYSQSQTVWYLVGAVLAGAVAFYVSLLFYRKYTKSPFIQFFNNIFTLASLIYSVLSLGQVFYSLYTWLLHFF